MSQSITISDDGYARLQKVAGQHGLGNVEQLLESWPAPEEISARFQSLVKKWKNESALHSNIAKKAMHPAYQEIIGMGTAAVPLMLAELRREPDDWFWALHAITGANPVPEQSRGNLRAMAEAWIQWGKKQGYAA